MVETPPTFPPTQVTLTSFTALRVTRSQDKKKKKKGGAFAPSLRFALANLLIWFLFCLSKTSLWNPSCFQLASRGPKKVDLGLLDGRELPGEGWQWFHGS